MKYETYREHLTELQLTINELRERIKKLEAQPGGDLIYRQQAVKAMYDLVDGCEQDDPYRENPHIDAIIDTLENLPPAQPKTGRWINKSVFYGDDIEEWQTCQCSKCGRWDTRPYMYYFSEPNYCSYCGAKRNGGIKE